MNMNKIKQTAYMFLLWAMLGSSGCSGKNQMYLEAKPQDTKTGQDIQLDTYTDAQQGAGSDAALDENAASTGERAEEDAENETDKSCFVYVCGAVNNPGVYELPAGSRIYEAIALAGGLRKDASPRGINQAQPVLDGDMVEVLTVKEQKELEQEQAPAAEQTGTEDGRININTASAAELMSLNGIGEAKAANIIAYREEHGKFLAVEELMNVDGIGEGVYAKVQDKITVTD